MGVLVGGLVGALADSDAMAGAEVDLDDANILKVTLEAPVVERGGNDVPFSFSWEDWSPTCKWG